MFGLSWQSSHIALTEKKEQLIIAPLYTTYVQHYLYIYFKKHDGTSFHALKDMLVHMTHYTP